MTLRDPNPRLDRNLTICPDLTSALVVERHEPAKAVPSAQVLAGWARALPARSARHLPTSYPGDFPLKAVRGLRCGLG
jgi:hypothetical protein